MAAKKKVRDFVGPCRQIASAGGGYGSPSKLYALDNAGALWVKDSDDPHGMWVALPMTIRQPPITEERKRELAAMLAASDSTGELKFGPPYGENNG